MITREAFNALLKIMEEPPSHLVFILATTEIEKIPKTILSRVQKFEFNKIGRDDIIKQIDIILNDRNISMEDEAKDLIVKKAKGAMRDALSILDQVLSIDKDNFLLQDVENILGVVDFYSLDKLVDNIISYNQKDSLEILFKLKEKGKDDRDILDGLVGYLRDIMVYKTSLNEKYVDNLDYIDLIKEKIEQISSEKIVSYLEILNDYSNRMKVSENSSLLMEMAILRLINLKDEKNILSRIEKLERNQDNDQVDIINKLVDQKFKNINLDKFLENSKRDFEKKDTYEQKPVEKEVPKREELDQENFIEETTAEKIEEKKDENIEEKNPTESSNNSYRMDTNEEEIFISELLNSSSPILRAQIKDEGFNYDLIGDSFTIYYKNNIYYQFLDETKSKMKEILKSLLGKDFDVKVSSIDKKKSSTNNNIRGSKKDSSDDVIEKLVEVFNSDLIIEE